MRARALLAVAAAALLAPPALADTVKLKNGDVLTGKVVDVLDGKVTLKTDAAGEVKIDVAQVETIATDDAVEVGLSDGSQLHGKLVASSGGAVDVESSTLGRQAIMLTAIKSVNKPPRQWHGGVAGSASWVRGNTDTDAVALEAHAENRGDIDRITLDAWWRASRSEDPATGDKSTTERRYGAFGQYDYFFNGEKFYGYGNLRAEKDAIAAIDLRVILGAGVGYQLLDLEQTKLSAEAGAAWFYENYSNGTETVSDPALRVAAHFDHDFSDKSTFFDDLEAYKVLGDPDDYLVRNKGGFRQKLTESFFAQEWVEWLWDSTPAAGKERVDVTYFLGIGWTF